LNIKVANRERYPSEFLSLLQVQLSEAQTPSDIAVIERRRGGYFFGRILAFVDEEVQTTQEVLPLLDEKSAYAQRLREEITLIVEHNIKPLSWRLEQLRLEKRKRELNKTVTPDYLANYLTQKAQLELQLSN